ncbi:methionine--tRNA ligase [Rugosimonospora africana]|uniref:Methionine--tRNA ligase n=1 Tax=Rugosimonospora africana TaxID=556532 RepID=A0A8J3QUU9_9ACTN|nr:methionine--tRNA ligase [Rugosimonospora africana]GIH17464.1 methionine--tRNA ligase [Rugosimonospora africana]
MTRVYLTTAIPYVNAAPHLGFALEAVQADVLARHHRQRGDEVRLLTGTDDNSLKNVLAAQAAGVPVREFVDRNAEAFAALRGPLALSCDDFIRTSRDPRHETGVRRLWHACAAAGDLYRARYEGLYCVGCEHYLTEDELDGGCCPEHRVPPTRIAEENWFFRLSRYADRIHEAIACGRLRIEPAGRRNEVLSFIEGGLRDFSVSRSQARARGWGISVPGDDGQVVYVWWDALGNYLTSLDYGGDERAYQTWWAGADRRVHVIGKGVLRFHAVYWPAMLLSAGLPLPTDILVHDYLTVDGRKISKSSGTRVDPVELVHRYGTDAVRWWLLREVPRVGDADFTVARMVGRANEDLAGGIGNLVNRVVTMVHRYRDGRPDPARVLGDLPETCRAVPEVVAEALADLDFRRAIAAVWTIVEQANRYIERERPWELARAERAGDPYASERLNDCLSGLVEACRFLGERLAPFLPDASARVLAQCTPVGGLLPPAEPLFPRIDA